MRNWICARAPRINIPLHFVYNLENAFTETTDVSGRTLHAFEHFRCNYAGAWLFLDDGCNREIRRASFSRTRLSSPSRRVISRLPGLSMFTMCHNTSMSPRALLDFGVEPVSLTCPLNSKTLNVLLSVSVCLVDCDK